MKKRGKKAATRQRQEEWDIKKHAVVRFRQRFLRKAGKNGRQFLRGRRFREEEVRRIMRYYLRRANEFAVEKNAKSPAIILLAKSEYGNIYFITRGRTVHTVYPEIFVSNKLKQGIWEKI